MSSEISHVRINFHKTTVWGIPVTISCGDQSVDLCTYNSSDSYPSLLRWLEAITTGVQYCAFDIDQEGTDKRLLLEQLAGDNWFSIVDACDSSQIFIHSNVELAQIVRAFYCGLNEYSRSSNYIQSQWRGETFADRIADQTDISNSIADIKATLIQLDRKSLIKAFSKAVPAYEVKFPDIKDKKKRKEMELYYLFDPEGAKTQKNSQVKEVYLDVRADFDLLSLEEKSQYIDELLKEPINSLNGCTLGDLTSPQIENWLSETKT